MAGHRKWADIRDKGTTPQREERIAQARRDAEAEIAAYDRTLAQLRHVRRITQVQLAKALELSQPQVSRIEHQADLLLSTIRSYVEALGGELHVIADFPDVAPVEVTFEELVSTRPRLSKDEEAALMAASESVQGWDKDVPVRESSAYPG